MGGGGVCINTQDVCSQTLKNGRELRARGGGLIPDEDNGGVSWRELKFGQYLGGRDG